MLFACVIAAMSTYFLTRASQESVLATRAFYQAAAMNLAEGGIDEAMFNINNADIGTGAGWAVAPDNASSWWKVLGGPFDGNYQFGQGIGAAYVRVDGWTANTTSPVTITSAGRVDISGQPSIFRQIIVTVAKRPAQGAGLLSKSSIVFSGGVTVDAYNSALGGPGSSNLSDQVTVAADNATANISIGGHASIYGYVATGGNMPTVGSSGRIYGAATPPGVNLDPTHVRTDFTQNIPDPVAPSGIPINLGGISSTITLPRASDTPVNGRYLYTDNSGGLHLDGSSTLTINGPVDLILHADMQMNGNGAIVINDTPGASLNLFAYGGVQFDGNGLANGTNAPSRASIFAMGNHDVQLNGNATFTGVIYAPNSNIQSNGNGEINGALTGNSIHFNGNAKLHYDTQLGSGAASPYYAVKTWAELTDASTSGTAFRRDNRVPFTFF